MIASIALFAVAISLVVCVMLFPKVFCANAVLRLSALVSWTFATYALVSDVRTVVITMLIPLPEYALSVTVTSLEALSLCCAVLVVLITVAVVPTLVCVWL